MLDYHNDKDIKFEYDPQNNKFAFVKKATGSELAQSIEVADYTYTDLNSVFVNGSTGNDTTGDGTQATPYKTLLKGAEECTATLTKVIVLNDQLFAEDFTTLDNALFAGIYAATGVTATISKRVLDYTPADANSIFFDKSGDDSTGTGTQANPYESIAESIDNTDGTHQAICCQDSGVYEEPGIEFTGNFLKMVAADGTQPTFKPISNYSLTSITNAKDVKAIFDIDSNSAIGKASSMSTGDWVVFYTFSTNAYIAIYDDLGVEVKAPTLIESTNSFIFGTVKTFSDNGFVVAYVDSSDSNKGKFQIFDSTGTQTVSETTFESGQVSDLEITVNFSDQVILCFVDDDDSDKGKFVVYDQDGTLEQSEITFHNGTTQYIDISVFSNDDFIMCYTDGDDLYKTYYVIYDDSWSEDVSETAIATSGINNSIEVLPNQNFVVTYQGTSNYGYFLIKEKDDTSVKTETAYQSTAMSNDGKIGVFSTNDFSIIYENSSGSAGYYQVFDKNGNSIVSEYTFTTNDANSYDVTILNNDRLTIVFQDLTDTDFSALIRCPFSYSGIKISANSTINGWILNADDKGLLDKLIEGNSADLTIENCDLINCTNPADSLESGYAVYSDDYIDMDNCKVYDNDNGVYTESDTADIDNSLFYRNDEGYACHIDGAASSADDISIVHCTFFSNYAGLRFENNNGSNELCKNNIFNDNNIYGINADVAITFRYSTNSDSNNNATEGTSVITANPLFIDEGELNPSNINLQLKLRVLGYPADSPAYLLGDDTTPDRDAGGWDIVVIGDVESWTEIIIEKPSTGIQVRQEPVNPVLNQRRNGSINTNYDAWVEYLTLGFEGILNSDYDNIMLMVTCGNSLVRIYPDPTTSPSAFNLYRIIYNKINAGTKQFKLSETGKQNLNISFGRGYE